MNSNITDNFGLQSVLKYTSKYLLLIKLKYIDKLLIGNFSLLIFHFWLRVTCTWRHTNKQSLCRQQSSQITLQTASNTLIQSIRVYSASWTVSGLKFVDLQWITKLWTKFAKLRWKWRQSSLSLYSPTPIVDFDEVINWIVQTAKLLVGGVAWLSHDLWLLQLVSKTLSLTSTTSI